MTGLKALMQSARMAPTDVARIVVLAAALALLVVASVNAAPAALASIPAARTRVAVHGHSPGGLRFNAVVRLRSAVKWCITLSVGHDDGPGVTSVFDGHGYCGTIRRSSAINMAFACPYGTTAIGVIAGRPSSVVLRHADGTERAVQRTPIRDRSGRGTVIAVSADADELPAKVVRKDAGQTTVLLDLGRIQDVCNGPTA
jgi:hypothetical protein